MDVQVTLTNPLNDALSFIERNEIPSENLFYQLINIILSKHFHIHYECPSKPLFTNGWAYEGIAELKSPEGQKYFDELTLKKAKRIYPGAPRSRLTAIEKYAKIGPPFPPPIYIQAKILEHIINRQFSETDIIMVDGARRIVAGCLCGLIEMKVILITKNKLKNFKEKSNV